MDEKLDLRIYVWCESKYDSYDNTQRLTLHADVSDWRQRYDSTGFYPHGLSGNNEFDNLGVQAYATGSDTAPRFYGYTVEYQRPYSVDVRRAEAMVRTLRRITRKLDAANETYGYTADLGAWLPRFALACGIRAREAFILKTTPAQQDMTGEAYRTVSADSVARFVAEQLATLAPAAEVDA